MTVSEAVTSTSALARRAGALARLSVALFLGSGVAGDALASDLSRLALPEPITRDVPTRIQALQADLVVTGPAQGNPAVLPLAIFLPTASPNATCLPPISIGS